MKQCREHNCPLQDICRGAVDNETWWNISEDCEIFVYVKKQEDTIFALENRLKECENGYEGTLYLDRCKLNDANEKIKELTEENERLKDFTKKQFKSAWTVREDTVREMQERLKLKMDTHTLDERFARIFKGDVDQIAKEILEGKNV